MDTSKNHDSESQNRILDFLKSNPDIAGIANYERLCKLKDKTYVICPDYCCGEFWESEPQFCCQNNFKPIRNLFYFLLAAFVGLLATIMTYVLTEFLVNLQVKKKILELKQMNPIQASSAESQTMLKDLGSSDETSLDDESSLDERIVPSRKRGSKPAKQIINKHSQIFKDMSKMNSIKRLARSKNSIESSRNRIIELKVTTKSLKSGDDLIEHLRLSTSSNQSQDSMKSPNE